MAYDQAERNNFQYVILEIDRHAFGHDRDALHRHLQQRGILARRYFFPGCHRMEPYRTLYPGRGEAPRR
jgi:dTDP-4-amino-4,6-dideoxygalactose transaminase